MKRTRGFTLVEILVASFIFAIIASIISVGLQQIFLSRDAINKSTENLSQLQLAMAILERDFNQVIYRPVRETGGRNRQSFMENNKQGQAAIEFTRIGYANPQAQLARGTLQRVAYSLENGNLVRQTWPQLDDISIRAHQSRVLLTEVQHLKWRFLDQEKKFYDIWPPTFRQSTKMPAAVEMTVDSKRIGKFTRLFLLPQKELSIEPQN